jgi:ABC-type multidrug transport system fused ATPase/permease subunit
MILLDPRIRDFVLLPIFMVVILMSALRSNLMTMFKSDNNVDLKEVKTNSMLGRCRMLKANANFLREQAYKARKAYFIKKDQGVLVKSPPKAKDPMEALSAAQDPSMMMGMMKNQMFFMVSQGVLAYWVSHLFSGFLVAKTPFPLTFQFKSMMQRGVEVGALEPGYVSSFCWYMFVMMSSHSLITLATSFISRSDGADEDNPMMAMMGSMGGAASPMPGGGPDMAKVYKQEQEGLEILNHEFVLENIETELWRKWRQERVR